MGIVPGLQPLSRETIALRTANRQDEARLDIRAQQFRVERWHDVFLGFSTPMHPVTAILPQVPATRKHEKEKRSVYDQRV